MRGLWILTSLERPHKIGAVVRSYDWGDTRVVLALAQSDPRLNEYQQRVWPSTWSTEIVPMLGNGPTYNEILRRYPNEKCYGFLADDALLDVPGMLAELERDAGDWNVAYANDQHHGEAIPTMPCIGGDLVRAVGYLSPSALIHWGIDCAWYEIGKRLDALRYRPELTYTHLNPVFGTAPDDRTYQRARLNSVGYRELFRGWQMGGGLDGAVERAKSQWWLRTAA